MLVYQRVIVGKHKIPWLLMAFIVLWLELVSHFLTCYFPATSIHILRNFCSARWPRVPCARCMSSWSGMARCCPLRCTSGQWTSRTAGGQVARLENKHPASSSIIQHHPASSSIIQHQDWMVIFIPVVPHKAVAEVSKIGNLWEKLVVVNQGWQSEATDWPKGGWSCVCWNGCNGCSGHLTHNCWM